MTSDKFNEVISDRIQKCIDTLGVKANEYATSDRLHNFKVAGVLQGCSDVLNGVNVWNY